MDMGARVGSAAQEVPRTRRSSWFAYFIRLPRSQKGERSRRGRRGFHRHMGQSGHAAAPAHIFTHSISPDSQSTLPHPIQSTLPHPIHDAHTVLPDIWEPPHP